MRVAIVDCFNGASGDMIIASLLGISLSESDLDRIAKLLDLNIEFSVKTVNKKGISAKMVDVLDRNTDRKFSDVKNLIKKLKKDQELKEIYQPTYEIFRILAEAEARVHGKDIEEIVFHEVGSDDAIFDVVSSALGFSRLISRGYEIFTTPINLGYGEIEMHHGRYPVPAPAVVEILKNSKLEVYFGRIGDEELFTPTASAILSYFSNGCLKHPFTVDDVSYGAGKKDTDKPNVLRIMLGRASVHDSIAIVETNIDDVSGEIMGNAMNILTKICHDISAIPVFGKKNRPGYILKAICDFSKAEEVARVMMHETGSLGVRIIPVYHRMLAERHFREVKINVHGKEFTVRFKVSYPDQKIAKPEFEDVRRISEEIGKPLPEVYRMVLKSFNTSERI
ncbi:TIGR00299 family protein [Archaeoglobus sulfaticallidus PM70-1]|uniref:Putative nickel insertion protein n=1 Tax=Archaeoglobus sulfaticallidus PM70-1 TaxID=387631 RepID=N0BNC4_9EURY|nr:nickel pincer cofactor biosynthesis protein LarC [Archaeoglobus sulfaticallidus]AGK62141.1 TIGR00299 family protein [Archaeoglobus sulfaticallidus PM70-1]